ncbi:MAG: hypothetical protein R3F35_18725 [Myxococcota bacterium]
MSTASRFIPVAPPRIIEGAYSEDQLRRLMAMVRRKGPWPLILALHFQSPEEVLATTSGMIPEGFKPGWDLFLTPVFRGYIAQGHTVLHPELEDCFFNPKFLDLVRGYWKAEYARPESMLFNIQGPWPGTERPHGDATRFRGISEATTPVWVMNKMVKSGLFERWRAKKAQVIAWYSKGRIGGGFNDWPDGPDAAPQQIKAPMWGRAVVVENEMMFHTAEAVGPAALRMPKGLTIESMMGPDPEREDGWQITTKGEVIQKVAAEELRFLAHWGAEVFTDDADLKRTLDHTDDIDNDRVFEILMADLRARGIPFEVASDPITDQTFIGLLTRIYDPGRPAMQPPEPGEVAA